MNIALTLFGLALSVTLLLIAWKVSEGEPAPSMTPDERYDAHDFVWKYWDVKDPDERRALMAREREVMDFVGDISSREQFCEFCGTGAGRCSVCGSQHYGDAA